MKTFDEQFDSAESKSKKNLGGFFFWLRKFLANAPNAIELYLVCATIEKVMGRLKSNLWDKMAPQVEDSRVREKIQAVLDEAVDQLSVDPDTTLVKKNESGLWMPEQKEITQ